MTGSGRDMEAGMAPINPFLDEETAWSADLGRLSQISPISLQTKISSRPASASAASARPRLMRLFFKIGSEGSNSEWEQESLTFLLQLVDFGCTEEKYILDERIPTKLPDMCKFSTLS